MELRLFNVPSFPSLDFGESMLRTARGGGGGASRFLSFFPTLDDGDASDDLAIAGGLTLRFFRLGGIGGAPLADSAPETTIERTLVCMANVDRLSADCSSTNCHSNV